MTANEQFAQGAPEDVFYVDFAKRFDSLKRLGADYRSDESLRQSIDGGDVTAAVERLDLDLSYGTEVRVVPNTKAVFHFVMPPNPNTAVSDSDLAEVAGGTTVSSAGTAGSAGSFACSTSPSTLSSVGSAGSASSRSV